jgi:hypothetical protein
MLQATPDHDPIGSASRVVLPGESRVSPLWTA